MCEKETFRESITNVWIIINIMYSVFVLMSKKSQLLMLSMAYGMQGAYLMNLCQSLTSYPVQKLDAMQDASLVNAYRF